MDRAKRITYNPSFDHHAKHELKLAYLKQDSNLYTKKQISKDSLKKKQEMNKELLFVFFLPGSKRIKRFAPIKLIPHPPAFELNKKTISFPSGSLNLSTSFCRLVTAIVPSSRKKP